MMKDIHGFPSLFWGGASMNEGSEFDICCFLGALCGAFCKGYLNIKALEQVQLCCIVCDTH